MVDASAPAGRRSPGLGSGRLPSTSGGRGPRSLVEVAEDWKLREVRGRPAASSPPERCSP
eukprot:9615317-Alexandrium_andersonii.AAC.1